MASQIQFIPMGPLMADMTLNQLSDLTDPKAHPELQEWIKFECRFCGREMEATRLAQAFGTCCDSCREARETKEKRELCGAAWQDICPASYRDRDMKDPRFPAAAWDKVKLWSRQKSLFLLGPSGVGKTWVALETLKRCLWKGLSVGVVWPEQMEAVKFSRDPMRFITDNNQYVLMLDDCVMAAARSEASLDALRNLIDVRMRNRMPFIITSQVGGAALEEHIDKYDRGTGVDRAKLEALLRRLRQECEVVEFQPQPVTP